MEPSYDRHEPPVGVSTSLPAEVDAGMSPSGRGGRELPVIRGQEAFTVCPFHQRPKGNIPVSHARTLRQDRMPERWWCRRLCIC